MGFYIRKSISVGPFRFNLSKSGIGLSAGITGLRLGKGPRGTYIHAGRGGVYYRKTLSTEPGGLLFHSKPSGKSRDEPQTPALESVDSGPVLRLVDAGSVDVLRELNSRTRSHGAWLAVICTAAIVGGLYLTRLPWWLSAVATVAGLFVILFLQQRNSVRNTVALLYDLESEVERAYSRLHEVFDDMRSGDVWHVEARSSAADVNDASKAIQDVRRKRISITTGVPPGIRCNLEAPILPVGEQTLFFFPDMLLVYENGIYGAVSYRELEIVVKGPRTDSTENIEELHFRSGTGLNELVQIPASDNGAKLKQAIIDLAKFSHASKVAIE